jgi:hypothetical protein
VLMPRRRVPWGKGRLGYFPDSLVLVRPVKNDLTGESLCT